MYNRYIPQPDGSYRRRPVREMHPQPSRPEPQREAPPRPQPASPESCPVPPPQKPQESAPAMPGLPYPQQQPQQPRRPAPRQERPPALPVGSFLRQLLPKDFGTEDLLVALLLLLMAGEGQEDQNTALLTLALYLFL